jgi:hypothetical protein
MDPRAKKLHQCADHIANQYGTFEGFFSADEGSTASAIVYSDISLYLYLPRLQVICKTW